MTVDGQRTQQSTWKQTRGQRVPNAATRIRPTLARIARNLRAASRTPKHQKTAVSGTSAQRIPWEVDLTRWNWLMCPGTNSLPTWRTSEPPRPKPTPLPSNDAIDTAHTIHPRKQQQLSIEQALATTIRRTLNNLSTNRHARFAPTHNRHFDSQATTPLITFDSGADSHYLSETDHLAAGLPILRSSTRQVGVANGSTSTAKYVSQLPFPQLSPNAVLADSFVNFPQSLMSLGKTCDDGTVAIFTQSGVTVHKDTDVLITCQGKPLLIGAAAHMDVTASHSPNTKDGGNRGAPPRRLDKHSDMPTVYTTSHPPNKPSDGCMRCVDTLSSPPGSKPSKPAISVDGHC
eukprot:CCRYP_011439-RA/>CCRYP_011439-RA protein AED:0.52 eAED:0.52 QI:0/0/0/0.5/1/1/2/0/345